LSRSFSDHITGGIAVERLEINHVLRNGGNGDGAATGAGYPWDGIRCVPVLPSRLRSFQASLLARGAVILVIGPVFRIAELDDGVVYSHPRRGCQLNRNLDQIVAGDAVISGIRR